MYGGALCLFIRCSAPGFGLARLFCRARDMIWLGCCEILLRIDSLMKKVETRICAFMPFFVLIQCAHKLAEADLIN